MPKRLFSNLLIRVISMTNKLNTNPSNKYREHIMIGHPLITSKSIT